MWKKTPKINFNCFDFHFFIYMRRVGPRLTDKMNPQAKG